MSAPIYQLLEDALLARLEARMTGKPLKFYAFEEGRKIEKPAVIVRASESEQDPMQSPIYWYDVSIELRANIKGQNTWTREQFGDSFGELKDSVQYSDTLAAELTSGRLVVYGAEYEGDSESELEGNTLSRTFNFRCLATCLAEGGEVPTPPTPIPPDPDPDPPEGYFASTGGLPQNDGSYDNPWDLRSALDGTQTIEAGKTLWLIDGIYDNPLPGSSGLNVYRYYDVNISDVTVRPLTAPNCQNPQPVLILGGFNVLTGQNSVTIRDLVFENPDPLASIGVTEPTDDGSPAPDPKPPGWDDWGASGVAIADGTGHQVINCRSFNGKSAFSSFSSNGTRWYGCIAHDYGWESISRTHGHAQYTRNLDAQPAPRAIIKHNLLGSKARQKAGHHALHLFATNPDVHNVQVEECATKGSITIRSENSDVSDIIYINNVAEGIDVAATAGEEQEGANYGDQQTNDLIRFEGNTFVNIMIRLLNNTWTNVTESDTNVYKTDPNWHWTDMRGPPGNPVQEPGTFHDISAGGGVDQSRLWLNEFSSNRAHLVILDLDRDGQVDVDISGLAAIGQRICAYHYKNFDTAVIDLTYSGGNITLPITEATGDRTDMFVLFADDPA